MLADLAENRPIESIDLLDPEDRARQLGDWGRTPATDGLAATVTEQFATMLARAPEAIAVVDGARSLSYAELDRRANTMAARLIAAGVQPGAAVGVSMSRSAATVIAVLGTLKAGAAYLPIDRAHPRDRVSQMLDNAGVQVAIVDDSGAAALLPERLECVEVDPEQDSGEHSGNPAPAVSISGDSIAYVMYTSGSTGEPKGVEIRHRGILRLVCGVDYASFGPQTRYLQVAPLGFDASTLELWAPLLNGGCVVVHPELVPTGTGIAASIRKHRVTTTLLTAALLNAVVDEDPLHLAGLEELLSGGEAMSVDHVRRLRAALPTLRLVNCYGPTECTVIISTHEVGQELPADATAVPIGRPIADTRVYVFNARRELVPSGILGELYVGGSGLARGYANQEQLTAGRFVGDPFRAGERLYRTGDQVRFLPDGTLEFAGRRDSQVKVRGFRIELSEIEQALQQHAGIQSCAVVARPGRTGSARLLAYYVAGQEAPTPSALRAHLTSRLPEFMVPVRYLRLDAFPVTINGKLDSKALPEPDRSRPELACAFEAPFGAVESEVCDAFGELLDIDAVGRHDNFFELGGNSLLAVQLVGKVAPLAAAKRVPVTLLFRNPTPASLAAALSGSAAGSGLDPARIAAKRLVRPDLRPEPIAIIGMAGRFPGAADVEAFWDNLCEGRESITRFEPEELDPAVSVAERSDPAYVRARGVIEGVELFDAAFFGISPKEAELMDPQQRIFMELCWECMERGGHAPDSGADGPVGVFAGMYTATYMQRHVAAHPELVDKLGALQVLVGNEKDFIATRIAHKLNLTGPAISVNTACSTSLVAICQAVNSLRAGECDMALAGGVAVTCPPRSGYLHQDGTMLSPDGHTRSFDANAQGTVFSDGAAVVLLKRLSDARADGDPVVALIRGGAINNDGGQKASFTAPSSDGQAAVIAMAQDNAGVDPRSVSYVEAHGTATSLGDPIEIEGLTKAFRRGTHENGFCRVGSVKSNVGHLVMAAGAAGVIKTALSLAHRKIPASLHFETRNPNVDFAGSPFVVNAGLSEWASDGSARRAGVSSFGVGGTNAHAVLEEAPPAEESEPAQGPQLLVLSARTPAALGQACVRLADHLEASPDVNLADVAWTLAVGRKAFAHRLAVVADEVEDAATALRGKETAATVSRSRPTRQSDVVFMFPGQGATYPGMGRSLYRTEPVFRASIDECAQILADGEDGFDLRKQLFDDDPEALLPTAIMQPATFAIEYALAQVWMKRYGVVPTAMVGHSVGEFVAATLAGVFALPDALRLVAHRGALMQAQPPGGMLSVRMPLDALLERLPQELALAAENAPGACVVAGPSEAIGQFQAELEGDGVACRALRTSHAFHSAMMQPVVEPFRAAVAAIALSAPQLPMLSTVSGDWLDDATATSPEYWSRHLRKPVRFAGALGRLLDVPARVLLEVGPRSTLSTLSRQHPGVQKQSIDAVATLSDNAASEAIDFARAMGRLWCRGVRIDPAACDRRSVRQRLRLPTYPFERKRHWVDAAASTADAKRSAAPAALAPSGSHDAVAQAIEAAPAVLASAAGENAGPDRKARLVARLREVFQDISGFDMGDADVDANFVEAGLDSLMLTQVALQLQKVFSIKVTFRQLMSDCASLDKLAERLDAQLPAEEPPAADATAAAERPDESVSAPTASTASTAPAVSEASQAAAPAPTPTPTPTPTPAAVPAASSTPSPASPAPAAAVPTAAAGVTLADLIAQQMRLMERQLELLAGQPASGSVPAVTSAPVTSAESSPAPGSAAAAAGPDPGEMHRPDRQEMQPVTAHEATPSGTGDAATLPGGDKPVPAKLDTPAVQSAAVNERDSAAAVAVQPHHSSQPSGPFAPMDAANPIAPGARPGRDPEGRPGWYVSDPTQPDRFCRIDEAPAGSDGRTSPVPVAYDPFAEGVLLRVVPTIEPQREVWLADHLGEDASLSFNLSVSLNLRGPLDVDCLQRAVQQLVDRRDALRASIGPDGETFCVLEHVEVPCPLVDLAELDDAARVRALQERLHAANNTPFRLADAPLFRVQLFRTSSDEHLLLLTAHHIVCDGWSWSKIVFELSGLYRQNLGLAGEALPQPEGFADYAMAEASHQSGDVHAEDEQYWLSRFSGEIPVLNLPTDRPRPLRRNFASAREDHMLDAALVTGLRNMGARRRASLFSTLLAGFSVLLAKLSGHPDVVIGIPAAGQPVDGHDNVIGHCVNLLPLLFETNPDQPFAEAMVDAQAVLLDALEHQRYTFGTLLKKLRIRRDPSRTPLVSVLFNLDQALDQQREIFPGLRMETETVPRDFEPFELFINAVQTQGELRVECQYNCDLFDATTVRRWLHAFETLLRAAVENEAIEIAHLPLVDAAARSELAALQPAPVAFDREWRMHEHFEAQCDRTPESIAVRCGAVAVSYAELEQRANRIAHLLRAQGVQCGALVGLAMDRDADMVAGLLGILKSGAGYVPLDPGFPADRLAYMAADAGLSALLTTAAYAPRFDLRGRAVLKLDEMGGELAAVPDTRIGRDKKSAESEDVAYLIYTSGSTGRPKGVQVPHRAVANFILGMQRDLELSASDRLLAVTTLSFDIAVLELLLPLSTGAEVVLADRDSVADGAALAALLDSSGATAMQGTPSLWRLLLDAGWSGTPHFKALCGGEALAVDLAERLLPCCGALWNLYGPTETTVWSTCARIMPPQAQKTPDVTIGRPIANTQVWVLDPHGALCPLGVPGEVYIGGEGVTLGYLERPELTAERFVADRFAGTTDADGASRSVPALLYRTGDRGRWRADGNLEHLGRLDHQVKVRGYRIEPGEIEANLAARDEIARALVIVREDRPGDQRLVAYLVAAPGARIDEAALRTDLRDTLPSYMVPQHFVALEQLPLLPNGKIDRNALPPLAQDPIGTGAPAASGSGNPVDPRQRYLADVWSELLGTPAGPDDNFFDLGGHSMLAVQMANRVARDTGVRIRLIRLGAETLAQLAEDLPVMEAEPVAATVSVGGRISKGIKRLLGFAAAEPNR
ncbi:non-ribosomal peptide synthetase/type I polyketide synthase [Lysobacter sp. D1-1-M9]|uniref:non-ribosomal peptide synthetase/type I polyketide synthase n=1 Tax=Novilysobacter longmucuonensis TaxID=3098603 RepID=UPI002FC5FC36